MPVLSAGLLMCRKTTRDVEFFLVHPGGPYYIKKNEGAWSIPKGIADANEDLLAAAQREFNEETGLTSLPPFHSLGTIKTKGGKIVHAWCFLGSWDEQHQPIVSNTFEMEWPPRSGKYMAVPEVDCAAWMSFEQASVMINQQQLPFLEHAQAIYSR
ncbi:MAG TPA: NUDIX domain-containing protein [Ohtaekwangia sp.]|uniref:NUDIX domain-containing protein n=1 Tax=Ohtaekwangia sp. TaxID=2066019 RepID=UPI002F945821